MWTFVTQNWSRLPLQLLKRRRLTYSFRVKISTEISQALICLSGILLVKEICTMIKNGYRHCVGLRKESLCRKWLLLLLWLCGCFSNFLKSLYLFVVSSQLCLYETMLTLNEAQIFVAYFNYFRQMFFTWSDSSRCITLHVPVLYTSK